MPADSGRKASEVVASEALVRQILRRTTRSARPGRIQWKIPFARETDLNREFSGDHGHGGAVWFFGALSMFVILYVIYVRF